MGSIGENFVSLDAKGRFLLPVGFKRAFNLENSSTNSFIIKRGIENCLELISIERWKKIEEKVNSLNTFIPEVRAFKRIYMTRVEVSLDSVGRILLPKEMIEYAKLKKDIVLLDTGTQIEIWDHELYKSEVLEKYSANELSDMAARVMKDIVL